MNRKHVLSLFVIFAVLFALSSCSEAGSGPPWTAFDEHTLTYAPISGVENREITAVSPKWNPPPVFANVSYTSTDLPEGLTLDARTGVIRGTIPTVMVAQTSTITATATGTYSGVVTATVSITITSNNLNTNSFRYPAIAVPVNIDIPEAQGFAPTWVDEHASPNNVKYSSTNLPEGLLLNQETGVIWGRPTAITEPRDYTITATAKDATSVYAGEVSASVSIAVLHSRNLANYGFKYDPADIPASVGSTVEISPQWTTALELPDAVSYSIENADGSTPLSLPTGLTFAETTGVISGKPEAKAPERDYRITVKPKDGVAYIGNVTVTISITVVAINDISGYTLSYPNPAEIQNKIEGVVGSPLSVTPSWEPTLTPGTTGISYKIDPALPGELEFDTRTGVISGKPTTAAPEQTYKITANGSESYTGTKSVSVGITIFAKNDIAGPDYSLSYPDTTIPLGTEDVTIEATWTGLPDTATVSYTVSPNLPTGQLSLNTETGAITGTPNTVFSETYTVTATASATGSHRGTLTTKEFTITISPIDLADKGRSFSYGDISIEVNRQIEGAGFLPKWTQELDYPGALSYRIEPSLATETPGLSFNTQTGAITGTPKYIYPGYQQARFTVTATGTGNHMGTLRAQFTITINLIKLIRREHSFSYDDISLEVNKQIEGAGFLPKWTQELEYFSYRSYTIEPPLRTEETGLRFNTLTGAITGTPTTVSEAQYYTVIFTPTAPYRGELASDPFTIIRRMDVNTPPLSYEAISAVLDRELAGTAPPKWVPPLDDPTQVRYTITEGADPLPAGLKLDPRSGVIRGTPTGNVAPAKDYSITVTGLEPYTGTREVPVNITITMDINSAPSTPSYPSITAEVGKEMNDVHPVWSPALASSTQVRYKITEGADSLPAGLELVPATGVIRGTPTGNVAPAKDYSITVTGLEPYTGTREVQVNITITMNINSAPSTLSYPDITVVVGRVLPSIPPKWEPALASPDDVRYIITEDTDPLPTGLTLNEDTGVISGTYKGVTAQEKNYRITAIGSGLYTGTRNVLVSITISDKSDIGTYTFTYPLATGTLGDISATPLWDIVPAPTVRYEISPPLPDGLNLDSNTGLIEGTFASLTHTSVYTVTATGTSIYTGTKTGVFLDAFVLPTEYTPTTTESSPISTLDDLKGMTASGTYHLTNHIDLGTEAWIPRFSIGVPFTGTLHGNGYAIYNLNIDGGTKNYQGLFAAIGSSASVKNLGIGVGAITGGAYIGALAGYAIGTLDNITGVAMSDTANITANGTVTISNEEESYVGGLVGYLDTDSTLIGNSIGISVSSIGDSVGGLVGANGGTVTGYATGAVIGNKDTYFIGGLVGANDGTVTGYATGTVAGMGNAGGLVGHNSGTVIGYATGTLTGNTGSKFFSHGGLVGSNFGTISGYATGAVIGGVIVGGLVGYNTGTISGYATGAVIGSRDSLQLGGLVGWNKNGTVTGYATGTLTANRKTSRAGGLVGYNSGGTVSGYATGAVTANRNTSAGGLVGWNYGTVTGYATGKVEGGIWSVGGLVGLIYHGATATGYATGAVTKFSRVTVGGLVGWLGENWGSSTTATASGYWDQASTGQNSALGTDSDGATYGTFTGAGVSATKNIVYTPASSSYTDGTNTIFDVASFKDAFDLTGPDAASATWPKLKVKVGDEDGGLDFAITYTLNEVTTKIPLVQPTVSDIRGNDGAGDGIIEVNMPEQEKFPEGWPFLN